MPNPGSARTRPKNPSHAQQQGHEPEHAVDQRAVFEMHYNPYRRFPELCQSVRAATQMSQKQQLGLEGRLETPTMEHKVHSFARARSPAVCRRPKSAAGVAPKTPTKTHCYKHNEDRIHDIQRRMSSLRKGSCIDEIYGLQHVRKVIIQETSHLRKELHTITDPSLRAKRLGSS